MTDRQAEVLALLAEAVETRERAGEDRAALIREGAKLGIAKTTLARIAGLSRRSIYDILERR